MTPQLSKNQDVLIVRAENFSQVELASCLTHKNYSVKTRLKKSMKTSVRFVNNCSALRDKTKQSFFKKD